MYDLFAPDERRRDGADGRHVDHARASLGTARPAMPPAEDRLAGARVLVVGGSQFMGPPCVRQLLAAGAAVTVLNRGSTRPGWTLESF